uniref:Uncharacterized protein n=1 Tax=Rousettus aegyptiacus TaxID=9407 RepID=A0A7J8BQ03_ROUAE|nr:hypothetical protein HJG63_001929 [Rousettus aegyptiacus]
MALLTPQGVKEVFQFQKTEGRAHLRRLLNWEEFDELRDSRRSILLDTLYESIIFAVGKGFPWVEVAKVVKFTEELIKERPGFLRRTVPGHLHACSPSSGLQWLPRSPSSNPVSIRPASLLFISKLLPQRSTMAQRGRPKWGA